MQTLNVGAGRSNEEYKAAEEQRHEELKKDVQTYARYFYVAAACAVLGSGMFLVKLPIVNIGAIDLFLYYARDLIRSSPLLWFVVGGTWVLLMAGLGFAASKGQRWAFWAGIVLYSADMIPLFLAFNLWTSTLAMGVHGFFIMQWFKGQKTVGEIQESAQSQRSIAAGTV